jgi:sugar lactone lactonase YvrE
MFARRRVLPLLLSLIVSISLACEANGERTPSADAITHDSDVEPTQGVSSPHLQADAAQDASVDAPLAPTARVSLDAGRDARVPERDGGAVGPLDASREPLDATSDVADAARDAAVSAPTSPGDELCPDGFQRGDASLALTRIAAFTPSPEGVTVCPGGEVFVTVDGPDEIRRVPFDGGAPQLYASLAGIQPAGIDCDERGRLFVAGFSRRDGSPDPPILMVTGQGAAPIALPLPRGTSVNGLNGIVVVKGAGVFASDTGGGTVLRARELPDGGFETTVAAGDVLGANGLMYEPRARSLYLVTSFLPTRVLSFQVAPDGSLGTPKEEASGGLLGFYDGVAVDAAGTLYVAEYQAGTVRRTRDQKVVATLVDPASFAFRGGSLLVTSYHLNDTQSEGGLYALQLGVCGPGR